MNGFHTNLEQTIDELFGDEPFGAVDEQLYKWFIYSLTGKGSDIRKLDALNFALFKERLNILIEAVYQWHIDELQVKKTGE